MVVRVTSELPASADVVARLMGRPAVLAHLLRPVLAVRGLPATFEVGRTAVVRLVLLGVVPLWRHTITVVAADGWEARTEERGGPLRSWRHRLSVQPLSPGACRYTDEVELDAGRLTLLAEPLARALYRHRHRRWVALLRERDKRP